MRISPCLVALCAVTSLSTLGHGQAVGIKAAGVPTANPGYADMPPIDISKLPAGYSPSGLTLTTTGAIVSGGSGTATITANKNAAAETGATGSFDVSDTRPNLPTIDSLNTLATFDGAAVVENGQYINADFRFTMIGNDPKLGGTTVYPALIDEVSLQLLNADGSVFKTVSYAPFEQQTLSSPNFVPLNYRSGNGIEFADAVHRAEFYHQMKNNWHTLLIPQVVNRTTLTIPYYVNIQLQDGTIIQARSYFTGTAPDGSTFVLMLSPLFNFLWDNEVINQINAGNFTTNAINTTLFPNTYLFSLNENNPNTPGGCCVLGFHTYFGEFNTFPQPRWITQYASWISPGLFGAGFQDITALSHETGEAFDDPFVDNGTAPWQFPGEPANSKVCQSNLEVGDPIEVLANATSAIPVKIRNGTTFTYHPQNLALYQWFEMGATSTALDGAFSFPNETTLPTSALPCPQ